MEYLPESLIPVPVGIIFLAIGTVCLFSPEKVQEFALTPSNSDNRA